LSSRPRPGLEDYIHKHLSSRPRPGLEDYITVVIHTASLGSHDFLYNL